MNFREAQKRRRMLDFIDKDDGTEEDHLRKSDYLYPEDYDMKESNKNMMADLDTPYVRPPDQGGRRGGRRAGSRRGGRRGGRKTKKHTKK